MKRMRGLELQGASKSTFFRRLFVKGFYVTVGERVYLTFATKMADCCENVYKMTGQTNHYINEKSYVRPADVRAGKQMCRPFWWYGRVYQI